MGWEDMNGVGFEGIGVKIVTMLIVAGLLVAEIGKVGKISGNGEVDICDAEDVFYGKIESIDEGSGALGLQNRGFATVTYTGAPGVGYIELVADGNGGVKVPAVAGTGRKLFVVSKDATAGTLIIDLG